MLRVLAATCIVAAVGSLLFAPIVTGPNSRVLSGFSDAAMAMRLYDVIDQAGASPFSYRRDPYNGAPEGFPVLPAVQIAAPIQPAFVWATKDVLGITGAVNVFMLLGLLLTGLAMFLLLDRNGFGFLPSVFAALLVTFNPWMYERAISGHVAFTHGWVLILLFFMLLRLRQRRTVRGAAASGAVYGLCFLMASYTGLLATVLVAAFLVVDLAAGGSWRARASTAALFLTMVGVLALFLVPGAVAYLRDSASVTQTLGRSDNQLNSGGASLLHYVLPSPRHPVFGDWSDELRPRDIFNEKALFFGYTTILLAGAAVVAITRRRRRTRATDGAEVLVRLALAALVIALIGSLGRTFTAFGVDIPLPGYLIGEVTNFYRIYARLGFVVGIGLAVLAAYALRHIISRRWGLGIACGLVLLVGFELTPRRADAIAIDQAPAHDRWLAERSPSGIVAHYPMMTDERPAEKLAARELYFQRFTRLPLFEIYGPERRGTREEAVRLLARYITSDETPGILAAKGVRYVVLHDDVYRWQGEEPPAPPPELRLLRRFHDVRVYELDAEPVDLDALLARKSEQVALLRGARPLRLRITDRGFHEGESYESYADEWRWMSQAGRIVVDNPNDTPIRIAIRGLAFSNSVERTVRVFDTEGRELATSTVPVYLVELELGPFSLPPGRHTLSITVSPGPAPLGPSDRRLGSIFVSPLRAAPVADYSSSLLDR